MFKRKKPNATPAPTEAPMSAAQAEADKAPMSAAQAEADKAPMSAAQAEADRLLARGSRIKSLADEAEMWRKFAADCKPGRLLREDPGPFAYVVTHEKQPQRLCIWMDEDSAPLWADFARGMAAERERRLKDVLGS